MHRMQARPNHGECIAAVFCHLFIAAQLLRPKNLIRGGYAP